MQESYIRDYIINLLENTYDTDLERIKSVSYALDYILNNLAYNLDTNNDKNNYNKLTTCLLKINEVIKEYDEKENIPLF